MMRTALPLRRGYALVLTLIFIVLFAALLGVVFRELAGALRIESQHTREVQRDTGSIIAQAQAMALLETGLPPTSPYVCTTTPPGCAQTFVVTFSSPDQVHWTVQASPAPSGGGSFQAMPPYFGTPDVSH